MLVNHINFLLKITSSFLIFYVICTDAHAKFRSEREKPKSIMCYECNSEYDPRCGDPFNNYTIGYVNCSMKPKLDHVDVPPTLCRKTVQKVNGKIRVIRACGYYTDDRDDKECLKRSGTHEVQVKYCACTTDFCNTGSLPTQTLVLQLLSIFFILGVIFHLKP